VVIDFGQTHGLSRTASARFNIPAVALTALAGVLGTLAVTLLGWFRHTAVAYLLTGTTDARWTFGRIGDVLAAEQQRLAQSPPAVRAGIHLGIGPAYYGWLGYLLLGVAVTAALLAAAPRSKLSALARVVAVFVSVAGIAATLWALDVIRVDTNVVVRGAQPPLGYRGYLSNSGVGAWAMLAAFALTLVAAIVPVRRDSY
jgi:hypothetical protein